MKAPAPVVDAALAMRTMKAVELFTGVTVEELQAKIKAVREQNLEPFCIDIPLIVVDGVPFRFNRVSHVQIGANRKKVYDPNEKKIEADSSAADEKKESAQSSETTEHQAPEAPASA